MKKRLFTWLQALLVLSLVFVFAGCPEDDDGDIEEPVDPVALVRQGWSSFEALDYLTAVEQFEDAIAAGAGSADAYSGAGWSAYKLADNSYAHDQWMEGLDIDPASYDIRTGLGLLAFDQGNDQEAIDWLSAVLADNANYSFVHIESLDYNDLHVMLAASYYGLGDFEAALQEVLTLNPVYVGSIETPAGIDALAREIERLNTVYRG